MIIKFSNKGITLISLVVTIIVLIILAGISISLILGDNGIIKNAKKATTEYRYSVALEKLNLKISEFSINSIQKNGREGTLRELSEYLLNSSEETEIILKEYNKIANVQVEDLPAELNNIIVEVVNYEEFQFLVNRKCIVEKVSFDNGENFSNITNPDKQDNTLRPLVSEVEIGDYVKYNALAYDENGDIYSYTSLVGTGANNGNGFGDQIFITSSDIKWRVLSKNETTGEVVLISAKLLKAHETGYPFYMQGAIAYLYAEEELNRICSIYGHGEGANTNKVFTCYTGDTIEGLDTVELTGSGARSINADDINNITGFGKTSDSTYAPGHGDTIIHTVGYPTKMTSDGKSTTTINRIDIDTSYSCYPVDYLDEESPIYDTLFNTVDEGEYNWGYWLASRAVSGGDTSCCFTVGHLEPEYERYYGNDVYAYEPRVIMYSNIFGWQDGEFIESGAQYGIRPIVYLKTTLETTGKNENGEWIIIDN